MIIRNQVMSKYKPLEEYLSRSQEHSIKLTFKQVEEIIGTPLPPSATRYRGWWSNNPHNGVIAHSWLNAGYKSAQVDMKSQTLFFVKTRYQTTDNSLPGKDSTTNSPITEWIAGNDSSDLEVLMKLRGTVTVMPGTDLTAPSGEEWERLD